MFDYYFRYISGEETEEIILNKFLGNFEADDSRDGAVFKNKFYYVNIYFLHWNYDDLLKF